MEIPEHVKEFYLAEYKAIRDEVMLDLSDVRSTERNVAYACAAVWAWFVVHPKSRYLLLIPVVLTVLGGARCIAFLLGFDRMHGYLKRVETALGNPDYAGKLPGGWENYTPAKGEEFTWLDRSGSTVTAVIFWVVLFIASWLVYFFAH